MFKVRGSVIDFVLSVAVGASDSSRIPIRTLSAEEQRRGSGKRRSRKWSARNWSTWKPKRRTPFS